MPISLFDLENGDCQSVYQCSHLRVHHGHCEDEGHQSEADQRPHHRFSADSAAYVTAGPAGGPFGLQPAVHCKVNQNGNKRLDLFKGSFLSIG